MGQHPESRPRIEQLRCDGTDRAVATGCDDGRISLLDRLAGQAACLADGDALEDFGLETDVIEHGFDVGLPRAVRQDAALGARRDVEDDPDRPARRAVIHEVDATRRPLSRR